MVLRTIRRVLYDHEVVTATRGAQALEILETGARFDVILTDLVMPDMTGVELFAALCERHASIVDRVVFLTGGAVTQKIELFLRTMPNRRVHKPFDVEALRRMVNDLIDTAPPDP
jgi:CheY-like chemotaxis protein